MENNTRLTQNVLFIFVSSIGGFILFLTGLSIGWMIGTIVMAAFLTFRRPTLLKIFISQQGMPQYWLRIGQWILAIELGQKINLSVLQVFSDHSITIIVMLFLSIIFSLLSGFVLWKFSQTDMLTSFLGTAPGGLTAMPSIAEDVGANTGIVSIIQTIRIFLVVLTIPVIVSSWLTSPINQSITTSLSVSTVDSGFAVSPFLWTVALGLTAWGGYYVGKFLRLPAPWLVGGMICVAVIQSLTSLLIGHDLVAWWPHSIMIISQILIASCIGSRFHKGMFTGVRKTMIVALLGTIGLILAMFVCAFIVSKVTGISLITANLAFAPGGIAEMATTAVVLHADPTFVVAVQVLRLTIVVLVLPPLFKRLHQWELRKRTQSHISA